MKKRTIEDFGNQWKIHGQLNEDHWTSDKMFRDHFPKTFDFSIFSGAKVLEVGSGSGRILQMISRYNPSQLIGIEPSDAFENLRVNTNTLNNLHLKNISGSDFDEKEIDVIVSFGVIHHIPMPDIVIENVYKSLKVGGIFVMWVYGYENNKLYVLMQKILRIFTTRLPDFMLDRFSFLISFLFDLYGLISKMLFLGRLPLSGYFENVFSRCGRNEKKYIIFDQLNPSFAKYYKKSEVLTLLRKNGFTNIEMYHRHGYSWTALAIK
jgi:SAM-dependent methyltransferase